MPSGASGPLRVHVVDKAGDVVGQQFRPQVAGGEGTHRPDPGAATATAQVEHDHVGHVAELLDGRRQI